MPVNADPGILKPSKLFRQSVARVFLSIIFFVAVYILLLGLTILAAAGMAYAGVMIAITVRQLLVVAFGLSLIFSGIMLVFFLIKFAFSKTPKADNRGLEITALEQPELFSFIRKITDETGAPFPKHVYLTPDVNASVFFDSSFWSMFFPVKKNLNIGLGLVNAVNQSEFKAVLAHEFGHFSQRSMRFGSYVYNLNKILYNLLYENDGYIRALNTVSKGHSIIRLSMLINYYMVRGIQLLLQKIYVLINKNYMRLSREMEFHADAMAAYVSGSNNVINTLNRIDIASHCYDTLINFLNERLKDNQRIDDFYEKHRFVMKIFADENNIDVDYYGLPVPASTTVLSYTKISIDNPWSSHPLTTDRASSVRELQLDAPTIDASAWQLFKDPDQLKKQFTAQLYTGNKDSLQLSLLNMAEFETLYTHQNNKYEQNKAYGGFYSYRQINKFDVDAVLNNIENVSTRPFDEFITHYKQYPQIVNALRSDINTLEFVENVNNDIKTFDYQGIKYRKKDAAKIREELGNQLKIKEAEIKAADMEGFAIFVKKAGTSVQKEQLASQYKTLFKYQDDSVTDYDNYTNLMSAMQPVYTKMTKDAIFNTVDAVYKLEKKVKPRIKEIIGEEITKQHLSETALNDINKYVDNKWVYYNDYYENAAIAIFNAGMAAYINIISERNFQLKKQLLDYQLELLSIDQ